MEPHFAFINGCCLKLLNTIPSPDLHKILDNVAIFAEHYRDVHHIDVFSLPNPIPRDTFLDKSKSSDALIRYYVTSVARFADDIIAAQSSKISKPKKELKLRRLVQFPLSLVWGI